MTPEQLAELFVEEQCDNTMNIHTCIGILVKYAYKAGYECAVNNTKEWLSDNIYKYLDMPYESFVTNYLKEIQL